MHRFAAALVAGAKLSDTEFAEIEKAIGRDGVAEVLVLLGYYTSVALGMKVHQVPIPPRDGAARNPRYAATTRRDQTKRPAIGEDIMTSNLLRHIVPLVAATAAFFSPRTPSAQSQQAARRADVRGRCGLAEGAAAMEARRRLQHRRRRAGQCLMCCTARAR